ncbi:MAG TPA: hypothetical protein VMM38_05550 [Aridibacter sp.]|nr:hypothetical protein [Aridibacter sp.]
MNYPGILEEILEVYRKHGWQVSRVLLSGEGVQKLGENYEILKDLAVRDSQFDAVWFERPSRTGKRAIELRWLSETPFALFELVDESEPEENVEKVRERVEQKMARHASQSEKREHGGH